MFSIKLLNIWEIRFIVSIYIKKFCKMSQILEGYAIEFSQLYLHAACPFLKLNGAITEAH